MNYIRKSLLLRVHPTCPPKADEEEAIAINKGIAASAIRLRRTGLLAMTESSESYNDIKTKTTNLN